jgi:hypothetical protein
LSFIWPWVYINISDFSAVTPCNLVDVDVFGSLTYKDRIIIIIIAYTVATSLCVVSVLSVAT